MDWWINYPWVELLYGAVMTGGLITLILLTINKYPSSRSLARLIGSWLIFLILLTTDFRPTGRGIGILLIAISLFLYAHAFFEQKSRITWRHLIPLVLFFIPSVISIIPLNINYYGAVVAALFYFVVTGAYLRREGRTRGISWFINPGSRLSWFRNFYILNALFFLYLIIRPDPAVYEVAIGILVVLCFILFQVFKESAFLSPIPLGNKYKKSTLSPAIKASILDKLDSVMTDQKFYLRDDASLSSLASELGATTHHLSQVLNESKGISFQDLLAQHRIREACRLLKDPAESQIKIENIAAKVGYNSKSAFNTAFKRRTGVTPSMYKELKDVRTYREERLPERKNPSNGKDSGDLNHVFILKIESDMITNFFKIFFRNLNRNRVFSMINLFGLTVGFACSILIYLFISDERSFDKEIPDYERIHRISWISENPQTRTPHPMAQAMVQDFPEIESAVSISPWYGPGLSRELVRVKNVKKNILFEEPNFFFVDSTFFDVFNLEVIEGDADALRKPWTLVITEEMAQKYFGDSSAINQEIQMNDMPIAVSAVVRGMPGNSHFHFNALISYVTLKLINPDDDWMTWADFGHFNYIKTKPGVDRNKLESAIPEWVSGFLDWPEESLDALREGNVKFGLQPIADIHLNSQLRWELEKNGNVLYVYILTVTLGFLLFIAAINYVNLTTAKSMERAREIGVRKTLGAVSANLSVQFYLESIAFCLIALLFAFGATYLMLNGFNSLSGKNFLLTDIFNQSFLLKAIGFSILIGVFAGFYPAMSLSSFKPAEVLKGKLTASSRGIRLRSILVVAQFVVSAILIAGSLIVLRQIDYMKNKELGFDQEAVISVRIPSSIELGGIDLNMVRSMQNRIEAIPGVKKTTTVSNLPGGQFNQHPMYAKKNPENRVDISEMMVSFDSEEVFDFEIVKGRGFDKSYTSDSSGINFILNESAVNQLNLDEPIGEKLVWIDNENLIEGTIVGVVKDFHYRSLHERIQPLLLQVQVDDVSQLVVKIEGTNFQAVLEEIESIYLSAGSEWPFDFQFLDQQLSDLYQSEMKTLSIFSIFGIIALILACLGLLGMAIAMINQRIKEVGMRKILGASSLQIMQMIFMQFAKLVVLALLIGLPVSFLLMQNWMNEFSYQVPFGVMPFIWSILILMFVALISVSSAVMKIAFSNPVDALRYE
ncbi:MAG: FtsX-like permease family protein [Cyclobacteriaceae bacterium]